jgi:hypothetical protein
MYFIDVKWVQEHLIQQAKEQLEEFKLFILFKLVVFMVERIMVCVKLLFSEIQILLEPLQKQPGIEGNLLEYVEIQLFNQSYLFVLLIDNPYLRDLNLKCLAFLAK